MAILVTGGCGYIGSHTVVELIKNGYDTVIVDNLYNSDISALDNIQKITGVKPVFYECDIRDKDGLDKIFTENEIEAVIHFAGLKAVGESVAKPLMYYENNVGGTVTLVQAMLEHGVKKIVFSSSATVYGDPDRVPITEDCSLHPTNPYGNTKYMVEMIHRIKNEGYKDISIYAEGCSTVYAQIAQKLYEGVDLENETVGLITYMRTDSVRLSDEFIASGYNFIEKEYGKDILELPKLVNNESYKNKNFYIIDDIYATGNTARAIKEAVDKLGGNILGTGVVINIKELNNDKMFSLIDINEE